MWIKVLIYNIKMTSQLVINNDKKCKKSQFGYRFSKSLDKNIVYYYTEITASSIRFIVRGVKLLLSIWILASGSGKRSESAKNAIN